MQSNYYEWILDDIWCKLTSSRKFWFQFAYESIQRDDTILRYDPDLFRDEIMP